MFLLVMFLCVILLRSVWGMVGVCLLLECINTYMQLHSDLFIEWCSPINEMHGVNMRLAVV